ncbi:MAG: hypothetical protein JWN83_2048 [Chitinophagaceae bacterium]|nr:hypothetical protein [Chitinophagaceae bacterium]
MKTSIACPSNRCKPGSKLLGIRQENGTVTILPEPLSIDESFIEKVKEHPVPAERRFRFTNKCIENGCNQWTGKGCGVIEEVVQYLDRIPVNEVLPPCSIRVHCRWFLQKGADACTICPYIITEITENELSGTE